MNSITYTRAVLVTGRNERGNEYTYWQIENEWFDGFDEKFVTAEHIAKYVYPNITIVRFGNLKLTRAEWLALGSPLEISSEQMNDLMTIDCYVSGKRTLNTEPATVGEMVDLAHGQADLLQGHKVGKVIVSKEFAKRWTNNPQHYKDYYGADEVEIKG